MNGFQPYEIIAPRLGSAGENIVIIADHASNHVPDGIDLGVAPDVMMQHVAIDIGVADVTRVLCETIGCGAVLAWPKICVSLDTYSPLMVWYRGKVLYVMR